MAMVVLDGNVSVTRASVASDLLDEKTTGPRQRIFYFREYAYVFVFSSLCARQGLRTMSEAM